MSLKKFENQQQFEEYKSSSEYKEPNISLIDNIVAYNGHTNKIYYIELDVMLNMQPVQYNPTTTILETYIPYSKDILDSDKIILSLGSDSMEFVKVTDSADYYGARYCVYNNSIYNAIPQGSSAARDITISSMSLFIHGYEFGPSDEDYLKMTLVACNISETIA